MKRFVFIICLFLPYYLFSETVDSTEAKYDFEFNRINLIGQKAKDNHDGLISYEENSIAFCDNQKSIKALPVCAASDIASAGYNAVIAKMDLKTILNVIFSIIIGSLLTEVIVNRIYKNNKKNKR
ncbi:MAG: hypothetical protein PWP68_856 [Rikenellaceae bacterium]|nr:hypothetical protein [Rikenellaceae bacterium]